MLIEFNFLQNFLLAFAIVGVLGFFGVYITKSLKKSDIEKPDEDASKNYNKIIKTANKHAKTLLAETTIAAGALLTGTKKTNEHLEENLNKVLQSLAEKDIQSMKTTTEQYEKDYLTHLQNIKEQIDKTSLETLQKTQQTYNERLEKFTQSLLQNGLSTQTAVDKKTAELLTEVESEIAEYKKSQFEKIDDDAKKLLEKVYRDVLRVSIPENLHQELIIKSLEEAKKDKMFKL